MSRFGTLGNPLLQVRAIKFTRSRREIAKGIDAHHINFGT